MRTDSNPTALFLKHRAMFSLPDPAGVEIGCHDGVLWITLDKDPRDIVLQAGESFTPDTHERALIYAIKPSILALAAPRATSRPLRLKSQSSRRGLQVQLVPA
jgi:hypothetical protein